MYCVADIPLSQKLQEGLQYEKEARTNEGSPEFLRNFFEQGIQSVSQGLKVLLGPDKSMAGHGMPIKISM